MLSITVRAPVWWWMALPCSGAASAPLPVRVVAPKRARSPEPAKVLLPSAERARVLSPTPVRLPQLLPQPDAPVIPQTAPAPAATASPRQARPAAADGHEARWDGLLRGVSRSEDAFGKRRRLSRIDPVEMRATIWRHRDVLMPGIRQAGVALEATSASGSVGSPLQSDPELLRSMLCEMLLWCAPSETPAAILRPVTLQRSPGDAPVGTEITELELGDLVTVSVNTAPHPGWSAVVPLCFGNDEPRRMLQWIRKTEQQHHADAGPAVGWLRKSDPSRPSLRGCSSTPRTLAALAAQAAAATAAATSPAPVSGAQNVDGGGGARAGELLHGHLRSLALADGLQKTAQQMLLAVCDILRGKSTAAAETQRLKSAGADVPVPKDEMAAAFRWVYSTGMTEAAGVVEYQGERYLPKGRLITAMTVHPELHAKYVLRHAHKRQYLSSWAKANVEHCMRVELYPWLTQTFEKANAVNPWLRVLAEDDPRVELLNQSLSQQAAAKKSSTKNKWWYCVLAPPDAMPAGPLPGYGPEGSGTAASGGSLPSRSAARVASTQSTHGQAPAASGPDPLLDLPAMDASMLGTGPSTHLGRRTATDTVADQEMATDKAEASSALPVGFSHVAGGFDPAGLIFT